ncbi:tRNA 2-selenouridine(34) synthase MnmH [Paenibacillus thailandensis]|uniref:tRNA 2-selenouridine(34) synthase MnmH n=1 Tax=Paenibacillus thailandensis TaxID=393250 RepID=A0ABW5QY63_9BACL
MFQDIALDEWMKLRENGELTTIDVRSPSEFKEATIPGSLNIPFFNDEERAEIGTIYKQVSVEAAKERGLEIVSGKLPSFIKQFAGLAGKKAVFCWRGGMRSRTTATVLSLMDIHVYRITGGYRAYRQWVVEQLQSMDFAPSAVVLHGNTGTGKTAILRRLEEKGAPVLDLEAMAGHRGSIFGEIGLNSHNQKMFDALLMEKLLAYRQAPYVLLEAESRRIGKAVLPDLIMRKKETGLHIRIELPIEERVRQIIGDYRPWEHPDACKSAFKRIKDRIHTPVAAEIESCLNQDKYERAVELLLSYYYDPKYSHASSQYCEQPAHVIRADSVDEAAAAVESILAQAKYK